jgi:hypothetical protein
MKMRVKLDIAKYDKEESPAITDAMLTKAGQIGDFLCDSSTGWYHSKEIGWSWNKKWLEPISDDPNEMWFLSTHTHTGI